jgi:hypothetical protein
VVGLGCAVGPEVKSEVSREEKKLMQQMLRFDKMNGESKIREDRGKDATSVASAAKKARKEKAATGEGKDRDQGTAGECGGPLVHAHSHTADEDDDWYVFSKGDVGRVIDIDCGAEDGLVAVILVQHLKVFSLSARPPARPHCPTLALCSLARSVFVSRSFSSLSLSVCLSVSLSLSLSLSFSFLLSLSLTVFTLLSLVVLSCLFSGSSLLLCFKSVTFSERFAGSSVCRAVFVG